MAQAASQVIRWLHEEALTVGIKTTREFLCLTFELEQGETVSLVAHVDPEDIQGCISWWYGFTAQNCYKALMTRIKETVTWVSRRS
ncbi:mediator of RNA polymerase II transcription subunit 17-like protein [Corchorus olitorius]|uniref:Mediator of RNA polymerase II transcription subunit 17-like protein n=1 Tax=Corchorus olitorius TaxID=93759 RepID=A0A1R3KPX0_9ROSI|nr:mediator of RNA polymerase II transcription subunit 17-like protein [Corchorus olitorius]